MQVFIGISTASLGATYLTLLPGLGKFRCSSLLLACALSFCPLVKRDLWILSGDWFKPYIFTSKVVFQPPLTMASQEKNIFAHTIIKIIIHEVGVRDMEWNVLILTISISFFFSFTLPITANAIKFWEFLLWPWWLELLTLGFVTYLKER